MQSGKRHRLQRFLVGMTGLMLLFCTLAFTSPRGPVVQRNLEEGVDATPLFYTESDRLPGLERQLSQDLATDQ